VVFGSKSAGFADRSLWEEAKSKNARALEQVIEDGLDGTSVTAVLIGRETASRFWVKHEIRESVRRGNALLGIHLSSLHDQSGRTSRKGAVPRLLRTHSAPIYTWTNAQEFGEWVESAWQARNAEPGILESIATFLGF
jgi:hypothetical protein